MFGANKKLLAAIEGLVARLGAESEATRIALGDLRTALVAELATTRPALDDLRRVLVDELAAMRPALGDFRGALTEESAASRSAVEELRAMQRELRDRLADERDARLHQMQTITRSLDRLRHVNGHATERMSTDPWSPENGEIIRAVLKLLQPYAAKDRAKARFGGDADGGYVMIDDLSDITMALSLGVGDEVTWDREMAGRGIRIVQFDHTIESSPLTAENVEFFKTRVGDASLDDALPLQSIVATHVPEPPGAAILKMDIESDEWRVIEATDAEHFRKFRQIICEFHHLDMLTDEEFRARAAACFDKLLQDFFVVHVHANNCGPAHNVANIFVPETLEITFANRAWYEPVETTEIFPTPLDRPNQPGRADIFLGAFRF